MKPTEVKVGRVYRYHATTGRRFDVRIMARSPLLGGWRAVEVTTGKPLLIRFAGRLRYEVLVQRFKPALPDFLDQKKRASGE
jgi:hypothetical protein